MRYLQLKQTENYIEISAVISLNNFGDQVIQVIKENRDGTLEKLFIWTNPKGNWLTDGQIKETFNLFYKEV
jgi:hypothetical protein